MLKKRSKRANNNGNTDEQKNNQKELSSEDPPSSNISPTAMSVSSKSTPSKARSGSHAVSASRARLRYVLRTGFPEFRLFSIRSMCVENVDFYDAVQKYKSLFPQFLLRDENNVIIDSTDLVRSSPTHARTSLAFNSKPSLTVTVVTTPEKKGEQEPIIPTNQSSSSSSSSSINIETPSSTTTTTTTPDVPASPSVLSRPLPLSDVPEANNTKQHRRGGSTIGRSGGRNSNATEDAAIYLDTANAETKEQFASVKSIIETFIKIDAPYQVNFSAADAQYMVNRGTPAVYFNLSPRDRFEIFERLEREILALLDQNLLNLFLQSVECDDYIKRHGIDDDTRDLKSL